MTDFAPPPVPVRAAAPPRPLRALTHRDKGLRRITLLSRATAGGAVALSPALSALAAFTDRATAPHPRTATVSAATAARRAPRSAAGSTGLAAQSAISAPQAPATAPQSSAGTPAVTSGGS